MATGFRLPRLYAILDAGCFAPAGRTPSSRAIDKSPADSDASAAGTPVDSPAPKRWENSPYIAESASADDSLPRILNFARELTNAGVTLIQYRNKFGTAREILSHARELKRALPQNITLFLNDRADLCLAAGFHGVHVGQDDLSPAGARLVVRDQRLVGVSTHNAAQLELADQSPVDYLAIGPIFSTRSKANPDPVVGLDGLRAVRKLTSKPLVAIGGITRENCRSVIDAGADSVAVIADLLDDPRNRAAEFLTLLNR
jgi:thiamine-phosphate pyrophosphorylase